MPIRTFRDVEIEFNRILSAIDSMKNTDRLLRQRIDYKFGEFGNPSISVGGHESNPNAHHARVHILAGTTGLGPDHTVSGLTAGQVFKASAATTAAFTALTESDLPVHDIITLHSDSGLTTGNVIRASGATTFAWAKLGHGDLDGITEDNHHVRSHAMTGASDHSAGNNKMFYSNATGFVSEIAHGAANTFMVSTGVSSAPAWRTLIEADLPAHDIVGAKHTVTASALDLVGATATDTVGLIIPSADPGAASAVLKSTAAGLLTLADLKVSNSIYGIPAVANTFLDFDGSGGGAPTLASAGSIAIAIDSNNSGTSSSLIIGHNDTDGSGGGFWADLFVISETLSRAYKDLQLRNGADLVFYSDDGVSEVGRWDGATGDIALDGTITVSDDAGVVRVTIRNSGDVNATEADIYCNLQGGFAADDNIGIFIDADNTQSDRYFGVFKDDENFTDATELFRINEVPAMFLNDDFNGDMTVGLTINQGANDNSILTFKSSDVTHGMTTLLETDTYARFQKASAVAGGLLLDGFRDSNDAAWGALELVGRLGEDVNSGKSTGGHGVVRIIAGVKSGTSVTFLNTNGNLLSIEDNGLTRAIIDKEGELHLDSTTSEDAWDKEADTDLLRTLSVAISDPASVIRSEFDELIKYNKNDLISMGILSEGGFINWTQTWRVMLGALWQQSTKIQELEARIDGYS